MTDHNAPRGYVRFEDCEAVYKTPLALVVVIPDHDEPTVIIPDSQIHDDSEVYNVGHAGDLVISEWIANKKGLI